MIALFISAVCDYCDAPTLTSGEVEYGFIVWRERPPGSCEYLFQTRPDAERWRAAAGLDRFPVRKVWSKSTIRWRKSTGSVRDIMLADRLFEIYSKEDQVPNNNSGPKAVLTASEND